MMKLIISYVACTAALAAVVGTGIAGCASAADAPQAAARPAATRTSSPPVTSVTPSVSPDSVQNLVLTGSERSQLIAAYDAYMNFNPSYIGGTRPGSAYYAYDPADGTYWAMASFEPSKAAMADASKVNSPGFNVLVDMQDGGSNGLFKRSAGGSWQVRRGGVPGACAILQFFPAAVVGVWGLDTAVPTGMNCG